MDLARFFRAIGEFFAPKPQATQPAPRPAASEPAAPQAAAPRTVSAKPFGFNAPASNPANLPRWQSPSTGGYGRTPSEDSRKRERATISERKPGLTPTYRELTWEEFDTLGEEEQAAVQYNTLMRTAKDKDAELIKANDSDGNGHVTMRESKLARDKQAGYREGFKKTYGREATDDDVFAPNTLALLNGLEVSGIGGDLTEFTNESGLIRNTDLTDLKSNTNTNRTALVKALSSSSTRLSQALKSGATAQGVKIGTSLVDTTPGQRAAFVNRLREGVLGAKNGGLFLDDNARPGLDVSALVNPEQADRLGKMSFIYDDFVRNGYSPEDLSNPKWLKANKFGSNVNNNPTAGMSLEEWVKLAEAKKSKAANTATDMSALLGLGG